jgi:glycosyltransferase involved in cell wall biosynthesis
MRVAHFGDLCDVAYDNVRALRKRGINAELFVFESREKKHREGWVHYLKHTGGLTPISRLIALFGIWRTLRKYDIIQSYAEMHMYAQFLFKPHVVYSTGSDLRYVPLEKGLKGTLMKRAFRKADTVLISNPDTLDEAEKFGLKNFEPIPFPLDAGTYREKAERDGSTLKIFCPSRLDWEVKGTDKLIKAFASFAKKCEDDVRLLLVRHGKDIKKSKALVEELGISGSVEFLPFMGKRELVEAYNSSDIVADQFSYGSLGTAAIQAMACGKPVISYLEDKRAKEYYDGDMPPVLNAKTENQIFEKLIELTGDKKRKSVGSASSRWALRFHGEEKVAMQLVEVYKRIITPLLARADHTGQIDRVEFL